MNVGGLLHGISIESIESIRSIESIESVESSDSIESIESIQVYRAYRIYSFGTRGFQKHAFSHFRKCYPDELFTFLGLCLLGPGTPLKSSGML